MTQLPRARLIRGTITAAPRAVPRRLVWRLWFGMPQAQVGWVFALFAACFLLHSHLERIHYDTTVVGEVVRVVDTGRRDDDDTIYRVEVRFDDTSGLVRETSLETTKHPSVGPHEIDFVRSDPAQVRLTPTWLDQFGMHVVLLVFVLAGLGIAVKQMNVGRLAVRLLRYGEATTGKLVDKRVAEDQPTQLTFEYEVRGQLRRTVVTSEDPRLEDDEREPMLFDASAPERALPLDHLPGAPAIDDHGALVARPGLAIHLLVLPALFAAAAIATSIAFMVR